MIIISDLLCHANKLLHALLGPSRTKIELKFEEDTETATSSAHFVSLIEGISRYNEEEEAKSKNNILLAYVCESSLTHFMHEGTDR